MTPATKIYEVMQDLILVGGDGKEVAYEQGKKYEIDVEIAATAPEGMLVEYIEPPVADATTDQPQATEAKPAPIQAKPWAGNHTV